MRRARYLSMRFWYPLVRKYTMESHSIYMPEAVLEEMMRAHIELAEHDFYPAACIDKAGKILEHRAHVREFLGKNIEKWGRIFVRGDSASPKDSCVIFHAILGDKLEDYGIEVVPNTMGNACLANTPESALALLLASERYFIIGNPSWLWARKPVCLRNEVRIFMLNRKPTLISWYYPKVPAPQNILEIIETKYLPYAKKVMENLYVEHIVLDIGETEEGAPILVEVTPFPEIDGGKIGGISTILFKDDFWDKLVYAARKNTTIVRYVRGGKTIEESISDNT